MACIQRRALIPCLNGIVFSDPAYSQDVGCRYESSIVATDWSMNYFAADYSGEGWSSTDFALVLACRDKIDQIHIDPDASTLRIPESFQVVETEVKMDTACVYLGKQMEFDRLGWQPACALRTGTDGEFGTAYELLEGAKVVGVVLLASIDSDRGTKESVWQYLTASFQAQEL